MSNTLASANTSLTAAWVCFDEGRVEDAILLTRQSLELASEGRPHAYAALGWFLLSAGSVDEAHALLVSSLGRYPEYAPLHWYLGLVHLQERRMDQASQALMAAVTFDPHLDEAAVSLAWVLGDLGRFGEATHYVRHALSIKTQPDRLAQLGWFLLAQEQWEEAAQPLAQALSLQPRSTETRCHLATALERQGKESEALQILSGGLALADVSPALLQQHIRLLQDLHRGDEARESVAHLLLLAPEDATSHTLAAMVSESCGDIQAASDHAEKAIARDGQSAGAWRTMAKVRTQQQRLPEAAQALQTLLTLDPNNTNDTYQQLGWICITERRFEDAIQAFKAAVAGNAGDARAWYGLAKAHHATKQFTDALAAIKSALHLRDDWVDAMGLHGQILMDQGPGAWEEAVSQLTRALALQPERAETRHHLLNALQRLDRNEEAQKVLTDGLEMSPNSSELLRQQAQVLLAQLHTSEARAICRRLLRQDAYDGINWYLLSLVWVQRNRPGIALRALARARRLAPNRPEPWLQTGWLALEDGDLRTARGTLAPLLALEPEAATSQILAAAVLERCGDLQAASEHAEKAIAGAPRSADAWRALAQVCARQERYKDAEKALHTALACDSKNTSDTYRQLGWLNMAELRYGDAVAAFGASTENNSNDAASWYGLAEANRAAERLTDALHAIQVALVLRRDWSNALHLRKRILGEQINLSMKENLLDFCTPSTRLPQVYAEQLAALPQAEYEYALCSFCTMSHLPLLRTLAASARQHFSGTMYLLVIDSEDASLTPEGATPVRLSDVIDALVWKDMVKRYNILELCCTLKPFLMRYVARATGSPVVYLDADTYLLGSLNPSLPVDPDFSVFLTPHLLSPIPGERHIEEIGMLRVGIYNAGMVGVGTGSDALRFLDWWAERVQRYAYDAPEHGVFTDQKWIDLVPSFFQQVQISRDMGLNVGPWRVQSEYDFSEDAQGRLIFCGARVRLMHVSRFNPKKPDMLTSYLPQAKTTDSALGRFLQKYALEVTENRLRPH